MSEEFAHRARELEGEMGLVYTAMSKHLFYYRMFVSKFVLEKGMVPLNPFMVFDYFLVDAVERDCVRKGNNSMVKRADEVWVFGAVSNGVLAEILLAQECGIPVKYFKIEKPHAIVAIGGEEVEMEDEVCDCRNLILVE